MKKYAQFVGVKYSEFEAKVLEYYPFADIHFSGGGSLIIDTGLSLADNRGYSVPINIETGLYLDDSKYDEEGEERICLLND